MRQENSREVVEGHLDVAMEAIELAIERWPGVASAVTLYRSLIDAVMKIYDRDGVGDVHFPVGASPMDAASPPPGQQQHQPQNSSHAFGQAHVHPATPEHNAHSPTAIPPPAPQNFFR